MTTHSNCSSQVRILNTTYVKPEQPLITTPPHEPIKMGLLDTLWIALPPIQRLLFYENTDLPPFPSLVHCLKSSLAATLAVYFPLAGKLTYDSTSGDVFIDSSPFGIDNGVSFSEAESEFDIGHLAGDVEHDVKAFAQLVPELDNSKLPSPALSVQVTRFVAGGVAVGLSIHHAVADGRSIWRFMDAWAAACRGGSPASPELGKPMFDRAVIEYAKGEEVARKYLRTLAPSLPVVSTPSFSVEERMSRRKNTFVLNLKQIHSLKEQILLLGKNGHDMSQPPSTFVTISALMWTAIIRSKNLDPEDDTVFLITADCRARFKPPVNELYFGNCIKACFGKMKVSDLLVENALLTASLELQKAIRKYLEDPLKGCEGWLDEYVKLPFASLVNIVSSPRFKVYETDFGWGKPSRVELVSMNRDGEVALAAGRDEGLVQVSVSLNPMQMDTFTTNLYQLLAQ